MKCHMNPVQTKEEALEKNPDCAVYVWLDGVKYEVIDTGTDIEL